MKIGNWMGILIVVICFVMITVWPGPKYWYIGAVALVAFMVWLFYKVEIE